MADLFVVLRKLDPKDWLSLGASFFALILSLRSYFQKKTEGRLGLRKQLTDVLEKLTDLNTEAAKFRSLLDKEGYPANYIGLMNDQRRFFVRQAAYLAEQIHHLVSPYEYLLIASAFDNIDAVDQAEQYFKVASGPKVAAIDRAVALRGYGRFLFFQGRTEEGRVQFKLALENASGDSDRASSFRGDTYERLAGLEEEWSNQSEVKPLLLQAVREYQALKHPRRRESEVKRITDRISNLTDHANKASA